MTFCSLYPAQTLHCISLATFQAGVRVREVPAADAGGRGLAVAGAVLRRGLPARDRQPARAVELQAVAVADRARLLRGRLRPLLQGRTRHRDPHEAGGEYLQYEGTPPWKV